MHRTPAEWKSQLADKSPQESRAPIQGRDPPNDRLSFASDSAPKIHGRGVSKRARALPRAQLASGPRLGARIEAAAEAAEIPHTA